MVEQSDTSQKIEESSQISAFARVSIDRSSSPISLPYTSIQKLSIPKNNTSSQQNTRNPVDNLDFFTEIKQFANFFLIQFHKYLRLEHSLAILRTNSQLSNSIKSKQSAFCPKANTMYPTCTSPEIKQQSLIQLQHFSHLSQHALSFFELLEETISKEDLPSNVLKAALKTVSKLFTYKDTLVVYLQKQKQNQHGFSDLTGENTAELKEHRSFQPGEFLKVLFECQFDTHDTHQEEVILLLIQKIVIQIVKLFYQIMTSDQIIKCCTYFFRVLRKRVINDNSISSLHMVEGTKANMSKLFSVIIKKITLEASALNSQTEAGETQDKELILLKFKTIKESLLHVFARKLHKNLQKIEALQDQKVSPISSEFMIQIEFISFIFKEFSAFFQNIAKSSLEELKEVLMEQREIVLQVVCRMAENSDIFMKNMAQQLFQFLLVKILELNLPLREEVEVLYTKVLLKPLEQLQKKLDLANLSQSAPAVIVSNPDHFAGTSSQKETQDVCFLSDTEEPAQGNESPEVKLDYRPPLTQDECSKMTFEKELYINILLNTILELQPTHLSQMFLAYDCQPLSENLVRRTLYLLLKHTQKGDDLSKCYQAVSLILQGLLREDTKAYTNSEQMSKSFTSLEDMLLVKNKIKKIVKQANNKPKAFFAEIDSQFEGQEDQTKDQIAAKILLNSRKVQIDKIAEIIGGKDARNKRTLEAYLERQDYKDCNIEHSLRSFMQTFRMAGVDSQVVFNILEKFGDKFFDKDTTKMFTSGAEAYNFTYLIIVLQTCQHNASIKEKTSLERFFGQAKEMVPESYENLPEGYVEEIFKKITKDEIKAPVSRDLIEGNYDQKVGLQEINHRTHLAQSCKDLLPLSEGQFLSTSDLKQDQLFDINNEILNVAPESLVRSALCQIVNILTAKTCQIRFRVGDNRFNQLRTIELTKVLIQVNSHFKNFEWVDRLLINLDKQVDAICRIQKFESSRKLQAQKDLQELFWENFDHLNGSIGLIAKLAPGSTNLSISNSFHYPSFNAVETKIRSKFDSEIPIDGLQTKQFDSVYKGHKADIQAIKEKQAGDPNANIRQSSGLFNMVYNYFTPVNQSGEEEVKKKDYFATGQGQIDILKSQLDEFNRKKPLDSSENVSETYLLDYLSARGRDAQKSIQKIAQFVLENMSSRKATTCIGYLNQVFQDTLTSQDTDTCILLQHTILTQSQNLVHSFTRSSGSAKKQAERQNSSLSGSLSDQSEETHSEKSDFIDQVGSKSLSALILKEPKKNTFDHEIALSVNKHLIIELYIQVTSKYILAETIGYPGQQFTDAKPSPNDVIKDVHKTLAAISEEELTREDFEQSFLISKAAQFLQPELPQKMFTTLEKQKSLSEKQEQDANSDHSGEKSKHATDPLIALKEYPKLNKFLRNLIIFLHQTNNKNICNRDDLMIHILRLIQNITTLLSSQETVAFDFISQCLDIMNRFCGPLRRFHFLSQQMFESILAICEMFFDAIEKANTNNPEKKSQFDLWFKIMQFVMSKVILSPHIELYKGVQSRTCNLLKTQILLFQFQPITDGSVSNSLEDYNMSQKQTKAIFEDLLLSMTYERLSAEKHLLGKEYLKSQWAIDMMHGWDDELEGFAQLCQLSINTLTDVFIYYAQSYAMISKQDQLKQTNQREDFETFKTLWNKFMLVLLNYADQAETLNSDQNEFFSSVQTLHQSVQDNISRVVEFLLNQNLLLENLPPNASSQIEQEKVVLYQKTKTALGLFWQDVAHREK